MVSDSSGFGRSSSREMQMLVTADEPTKLAKASTNGVEPVKPARDSGFNEEFKPCRISSRGSRTSSRRSAGSDVERTSAMQKLKEKKAQQTRFLRGSSLIKPPDPDTEGMKRIMVHPLNALLGFLPLGVAAHYLHWSDIWIFWLNFIGLVPLAKILGDATEELAANLKNDMLAGLLNATFGNAVEVVFTVQSLRAGRIDIVKATLLGSVLSNTLLVLGMAFFCGGIITAKKHHDADSSYSSIEDGQVDTRPSFFYDKDTTMDISEKIQSFSMLGALVNTSMLLVSCLVFSLVTIFRTILEARGADVESILLPVSRISSLLVLGAYAAFIIFQLVTHKDAMSDENEEEEEEEDHLSLYMSLVLLAGTTMIVAFSSDLLVAAISGVTENAHLSSAFIGVVLLPVVGNACEHVAAVRFAMQDKLGLSVSIAVGSSTQIALFVVPLSVLVGWGMQTQMDLDFGPFNSALITLSSVVVLSMVVDGNSNWLQGYLLCSIYTIVSVMFYFLPDDAGDGLE